MFTETLSMRLPKACRYEHLPKVLAVKNQPRFVRRHYFVLVIVGFDFKSSLAEVTELSSIYRRLIYNRDRLGLYSPNGPDAGCLQQSIIITKKTFHIVQLSNVLQIFDKGASRMPYPFIRIVSIGEYFVRILVHNVGRNIVRVLVEVALRSDSNAERGHDFDQSPQEP